MAPDPPPFYDGLTYVYGSTIVFSHEVALSAVGPRFCESRPVPSPFTIRKGAPSRAVGGWVEAWEGQTVEPMYSGRNSRGSGENFEI